MEYISGGRRSGRTTKLLEEFIKDPVHSLILCPNEGQATYVRERFMNMSAARDPLHPLNDPRGPRMIWDKACLNIMAAERAVFWTHWFHYRILIDNYDHVNPLILRQIPHVEVAVVE